MARRKILIDSLRSVPQDALTYYETAVALRPTLVDAHIASGKALTSLGQPDEALKHLLQAIALDPQNEVAHYRLAQAYQKLGRAQDAERERALFRKMRDSHAPVRTLYEQIQQTPVGRQTVDSSESKWNRCQRRCQQRGGFLGGFIA
ncbi:MAG: tetratricopeptide repeat protein [Terriglobia bacterium]